MPERRTLLVLALAATVALGLASRLWPIGWYPYDKSLGDALYAVAAYLGLGLLWPKWAPRRLAGSALGFCVAVEVLQLTGLPARYAFLPPVRWLLGTHFAWHDVICYGAGIAGILILDHALLHRVKGAEGR